MKCALTDNFHAVVSELTYLAYAASVDPSKWQTFLDRTSILCGHSGAHLFGHDNSTDSALGVMYAGYDPEFTNSFDNYYGNINCWASGLFEHDVGVPLHTELMCPEKELIKTEFYSGWVQPQDDIRVGGGVILHKDAHRMFAMGGNIRKKEGDSLVGPWLELLRALTPHLRQSFDISRAFFGVSLENVALKQIGSRTGTAVLAVDLLKRSIFANQQAERLIESGSILKRTLNGTVHFADNTAESTLNEFLIKYRLDEKPASISFVVFGEQEYRCHIATQSPEFFGGAPLGLLLTQNCPFFLISLSPVSGSSDIQRVLLQRYKLTQRESWVVIQIANGSSLQKIATAESKSLHTVRNQLKRAMSKLSISRQAELAAFIRDIKNSWF